MWGQSLESESPEGQSQKAQSHGGSAEQPDSKGARVSCWVSNDFKSRVPDPLLKFLKRDWSPDQSYAPM